MRGNGEVKGVVCDKKMPIKLKVKIYDAGIRPMLMYIGETCALRRKQNQSLKEQK